MLAALRHFPAQPARVVDFPEELHPKLREVLRGAGLRGPLHATSARPTTRVQAGKDVVVVTPTASGKTLCYNLPVLDRILKDPDARALYLFPTKALAQDQLAELHAVIEALGADIGTFTYDGDTPQDARKAIRARAHVVVTNPDMLHKGILPHHTKWVKLFENLRYVVIDELHSLPRRLRLARRQRPPAAAAAVPLLRLAARSSSAPRPRSATRRSWPRA